MPNANARGVLIASLASALAVPAVVSAADTPQQAQTAACFGINKCKGMGECGTGPEHSCAGSNACKRQGVLFLSKDTCLKIDGGRLTANEEKAEQKSNKPKAKAEKGQ
jgi:uncharacterized membrane protein